MILAVAIVFEIRRPSVKSSRPIVVRTPHDLAHHAKIIRPSTQPVKTTISPMIALTSPSEPEHEELLVSEPKVPDDNSDFLTMAATQFDLIGIMDRTENSDGTLRLRGPARGGGTITRVLDHSGNVTAETWTGDSATGSLTRIFDTSGDIKGLLMSKTDGIVDMAAFDQSGTISGVTEKFPDGKEITKTYDTAGKTTGVWVVNGPGQPPQKL